MTIRKQFTLLALFIIFIPIGCAAIIRIQVTFQNAKRYLIQGTQNLEQYDRKRISDKDFNELIKTIKLLPPDVQCILLSRDDNEVLFSTIPDYTIGQKNPTEVLYNYLNETSDIYFYQFTTPIIDNSPSLLVTRIPRTKHTPDRRRNVIRTMMFIVIFFVLICIIMVILISKTIFTSIIKIESKTQQLADGNLSEQLVSDNDNTKRNEITSIMESLEKMRQSIIEILNRKNKFIMGISHDLRTPVAIIKGYSEAITDGIICSNEEIIQSVELIEQRTEQLGEMIDTLINFMKLNENEIREKLVPGPICSIIKDFTKSSILTANVFKRVINEDINLPDNIFIPLNSQLVIRSFENLFSNALRYTNDGDTISIISYMDNNNIVFKICDSGIGIEEKDLNNIFDMFYRGTNSRREEGLGIGLSVVKNIMDIHGWTISVDSKKNVGTCFNIIIPTK